ncbi:VanZ family protein [Streptomyces angustmyceticus]|uniref:VanZ family protein n=1 Tax=Streptomyces angustmyceticus TaxID=285578 RepID=UPI00380B4FC9
MIEASIGALPGLIPAFLTIATILGIALGITSKVRDKPAGLSLLLAVALSGVLAVTLVPSEGNSGKTGICDVGLPAHAFLTSESARLNVMLFFPVSCLAVLFFKRPILAISGTLTLTCGIELFQSWAGLGRACSYDDIKANALGSFLGALLGTAILCLWKRRVPFTRADTLWGACCAAIGGLTLTAAFSFTVEPVHWEAASQLRRENMHDMLAQDAWLQETVNNLYGKDTRITQSASEKLKNGRWRLSADTAQGNVAALWPERKLIRFALRSESGTGTASEGETQTAGDRFAKKWFPKDIVGAKATHRPPDGDRGPHTLTYRRYIDGVMMPMRLDVTISASGRVTGLTARTPEDPNIPKAVVTKDKAKKQAERTAPGTTALPVTLLAQRVNHAWRPVWMISIARERKQNVESTIFIDAVTAAEVSPDPIGDGDL